MTGEDIISYIRQPEKLNGDTLGGIEKLTSDYPYFQTAHLLNVKNHHNIKSLKFSESLRFASAHAGDRTILYYLINDLSSSEELDKEEKGDISSVTGLLSFTNWFDHLDQATPEGSGKSDEDTRRMKENELIDKFIKAQPSIIPQKDKSEDQEDISEAFLITDDHLMTETLAEIYVKQGYYTRAIHAYEKLSLKYPEKSSYFATQINKIRQLKDNPNS
ncbi:MAG: hypothetical protein AMS27_02135 [Bacteroides sp. SM23_62_1]|nr:MAG: hypothetical protein AMS27_02135 [Bacteroides sp. SM23_62_1]